MSKKYVTEDELTKALNDLEESATGKISKGDELEDADTEGGLSTEGQPLSAKAKGGGSDRTAKSARLSKMMSESDMGSDDSEEDEKDDEGEEDTEKSFREDAEKNGDLQKALEVSDFLEALVDQISASTSSLQKSMGRRSERLEKSVTQSLNEQKGFNVRLAKAMITLGTRLEQVVETMESFANQPNVQARGKAVLSKSEYTEPMHNQNQTQADPLAVQEWLLSKAMTGQIDPMHVTVCEQSGYNLNALPPDLRKTFAQDTGR